MGKQLCFRHLQRSATGSGLVLMTADCMPPVCSAVKHVLGRTCSGLCLLACFDDNSRGSSKWKKCALCSSQMSRPWYSHLSLRCVTPPWKCMPLVEKLANPRWRIESHPPCQFCLMRFCNFDRAAIESARPLSCPGARSGLRLHARHVVLVEPSCAFEMVNVKSVLKNLLIWPTPLVMLKLLKGRDCQADPGHLQNLLGYQGLRLPEVGEPSENSERNGRITNKWLGCFHLLMQIMLGCNVLVGSMLLKGMKALSP